MKTHLLMAALSGMLSVFAARAAAPAATLPLWAGTPPSETNTVAAEADTTTDKSDLVAGKRLIRLGNVSQPTLAFYPAPAGHSNGATVVICPGGGYHILAMDLEGTEVAEWLNSIGVNAAVVKYRVPARKGRQRWEAPLEDAQRAMGLVRSRAQTWGLDPRRVGVMGFSAGAHLSAVLGSKNSARHYAAVDAADQESCRPDFIMLVYPAYLTLEKENDRIAPEVAVTGATPPTFLIQTEDDPVRPECALYYYLALKQAKVPAELHLYPKGGHGYGLRPTAAVCTSWPTRAAEWMKAQGFLKPALP